MKQLVGAILCLWGLGAVAFGQTRPMVAIHDSELTRALDSSNSPAISPTPTGFGTTGLQWWPTNYHYFVMPESVKEALRSDGTAFTVVGDSNITAGVLLTNGAPKYPILISLASEAIRDDEIAPLTNYVAAGGFLVVGSSAFTRNADGTPRSDFAFGNAMGIHDAGSGLTNWTANSYFTKQLDHRLITHVPGGQLTWRMPRSSEEVSWGTSPTHEFMDAHLIWRVQAASAVILAQGDTYPYLTVQQFGKGYFIFYAGMQPLIGHGGFAPSTYAYVIFRRAIEWAFETLNLPVAKMSPWPYAYDSTLLVRHDLENFTNEIAAIEASARFEFTNGAKGDYYFCTGTLRDDAWPAYDTNSIVAGMHSAITNYGATIGSHNGGLRNPNNFALLRGQYEYWHWGPDEALAVTPTNYASGKDYAFTSISNSFRDLEGWLGGLTNGIRSFTGCYFNATREDSYDLQEELKVKTAGDQKIGPFPHWTLSTRTPNKRYSAMTAPVSDWFVGGLVAQSLEDWHPPGVHTPATVREAVDFYYNLGAIICLYSHTLSTGLGPAGSLATEYVTYSMNTNLHPRLWAAGAADVYQWWLQRSNAHHIASFSTNGNQSVTTLAVSGSTTTNLTVEVLVPASGSAYALQVFTNGVGAGSANYRTNGQVIKVRVGTAVTNAQVRYVLGPRAQNDAYSTGMGTTLNVAAPGVLGNDARGNSTNVGAFLVTGPTNGSVTLNTNGGFTYTPANNLVTFDSFTYEALDEWTNASLATATIVLSTAAALFSDDFTRPTEPGALSPWVAQSGVWVVSNGALAGGTNVVQTYGSVYITNSWNNYSVQARLQFPTNAFGGGLGGRVTPASGKHYAAWVYPEGSAGGSNVLKLIKFSSWTTFGYLGTSGAVMQQVNLAAVGTNFHTVKLAFQTNQIAVYFDGVQRISVADLEAQPYLSGSVCVDMWRESTAYLLGVDDVSVNTLVGNDTYALNEDTTLTVTVPGVLTNDTAVFGANLLAVLVSGPTNGTLSLSNNGSFTYTPAANFNGTDRFTYQANDGQTNLGTATVTLSVNSVNDAPVLPGQSDRTVAELNPMTVTNTAVDVDLPPNTLSYVLVNPPAGAQIDTNGIIQWSPGEDQGPGTFTLTTVVTDDGAPPLTATNSFMVTVTEVNSVPVLPGQPDRTVAEQFPFIVTNAASDSDLPANHLGYVLTNAPAGAQIDTNGVIRWTPTEAQGPSTNMLTTVVTDDGTPPLSATNSFVVVVTEVNSAPVLPAQTNRNVAEGTPLVVTNTASDSDVPANHLAYLLTNAPAGAQIDTNGVIRWTPTEAQGPSTNTLTTVVTDDGTPPLSATNSFVVVVTEVNSAPVLPAQTNYIVAEGTPLVVTNTASDSDVPANHLGYVLTNAPAGAQIDTNGVIRWTPAEDQGPSTNTLTTIVTDDGTPTLSATNSFVVVVTEVNSAPVLPPQTDRTLAEGTPLVVTNTASDSDLPANHLAYVLTNAPTGAQIDTDGVITWTPTEEQGPSTNTLTTIVTDDGVPALSATNSFTVVVLEVNSAPVLPVQSDRTIAELKALVVTNAATDADLPANQLFYALVNPPVGAQIDNGGMITWVPDEAQGLRTNRVTTIVTDDGIPPLSATNSFTVVVFPQPDILSLDLSNGLATVTWSAFSGQSYQLQYRDLLEDPNWTPVPPDVLATGSTASLTNSVGNAPQRFYRTILTP